MAHSIHADGRLATVKAGNVQSEEVVFSPVGGGFALRAVGSNEPEAEPPAGEWGPSPLPCSIDLNLFNSRLLVRALARRPS
jgi:hypothetical protein